MYHSVLKTGTEEKCIGLYGVYSIASADEKSGSKHSTF